MLYDKIHERDSPPQRTPNGDYIVYHGTSMANARQILKQRQVLRDDWGQVGITTHPSRADVYGVLKASKVNPSVVLRLVIDKNQTIKREVGGSGRDQFLIHTDSIPSAAIKDIQLARVRGSPLKSGSLEYPTEETP